MINLYKIMFTSTLMMGTIMAMSSYSWMGMWMGLEINLLSIIPLMNSSNNILSSESSLKYFIVQAVASTTLLFSMILLMSSEMTMIEKFKPTYLAIMNSSLMTKMGAAPFHFWFPEIIEGLSWINTLIMLTWQKLAPMMILMNNVKETTLMNFTIISSMVIGGLMGINQTSLRKILAYSSINHIGWMLSALMTNKVIWMNYFLIYSFITANLIMFLKANNIFLMPQLLNTTNNLLKMSFLLNFLSMGGVPPFLGFLPKWLTINVLVKDNFTLAITMVIITLVTLFFYVRTILPSFTFKGAESMKQSSKNKKFLMWWMNWTNVMSLILCTLWFNLT